MEKIWNKLMMLIGNAFAVAGIMGNLQAESGLRSNNLENSKEAKLGYNDVTYTEAVNSGAMKIDEFSRDGAGYGLAQWTFWSRKQELMRFIFNAGYNDIASVDGQIEFLVYELKTNYSDLYRRLLNIKDIKEASDIFCKEFERPANTSEGVLALRSEYAKDIYNKMYCVSSSAFDKEMETIYQCLKRMGFKG